MRGVRQWCGDRWFGVVLAMLTAPSTPRAAIAAEAVRWSNPTGPFEWGVAGNWTPGRVPTADEQALFNRDSFALAGGVTLTLGTDRTAQSLFFNGVRVPVTVGSPEDVSADNSLTLSTGEIWVAGPPVVIASHLILGSHGVFVTPLGTPPVSSLTILGGISSVLEGTRLDVQSGTVDILGNAAHSGGTVTTGVLRLAGTAGAARASVAIDVFRQLVLDDTRGNNPDRLGDSAALNLRGGNLLLLGAASASSSEVVGDLSFSGYAPTIEFRRGAEGSLVLTARSLNRLDNAILRLHNYDGSMLRLRQPPPLAGSGLVNTPSAGVVPFVTPLSTYDPGADGVAGNGDDIGLRRLRDSELVQYHQAGPNDNAYYEGGPAAGRTLNSLSVWADMRGGGALRITSGAMEVMGIVSGFDAVDFGAAEAIVSGPGVIASPVRGSRGLTVWNEVLHLRGTHAYTGDTRVLGPATLRFDDPSALGTGPGKVIVRGGNLAADVKMTITRPMEFISGQNRLTGFDTFVGRVQSELGTHVSIESADTDLTFAGPVDLRGTVSVSRHPSLTGAGTITFAGPTTLGTFGSGAPGVDVVFAGLVTLNGDAGATGTLTFLQPAVAHGRIGAGKSLVLASSLSGPGSVELSGSSNYRPTLRSSVPQALAGEFRLIALSEIAVEADDALGHGPLTIETKEGETRVRVSGGPVALHNSRVRLDADGGRILFDGLASDLTLVSPDVATLYGRIAVLNDGEQTRRVTIDGPAAEIGVIKEGAGRLVLTGPGNSGWFNAEAREGTLELAYATVRRTDSRFSASGAGRIELMADLQTNGGGWSLDDGGVIDLNEHRDTVSRIGFNFSESSLRTPSITMGTSGQLTVLERIASTARLDAPVLIPGNLKLGA